MLTTVSTHDPEWDDYVTTVRPLFMEYAGLIHQQLDQTRFFADATKAQALQERITALGAELNALSRPEDPRYNALLVQLQREQNPQALATYEAHMNNLKTRGFSIMYSNYPADPSIQLSFTLGCSRIGRPESVIIGKHTPAEASLYHEFYCRSAQLPNAVYAHPVDDSIIVQGVYIDPANQRHVTAVLESFFELKDIRLFHIHLPDNQGRMAIDPDYNNRDRCQRFWPGVVYS